MPDGMALALFDLDHTLLAGDSESLWYGYLYRKGLVGEKSLRALAKYSSDYEKGRLDFECYMRFMLNPLVEHPRERMVQLRREFLDFHIIPLLRMRRRLDWHRVRADQLVLITAAHAFLARPIARMLGMDVVLCTHPEQVEGKYTGMISGIPCFREGKSTLLEQWRAAWGKNLKGSWFYTDSHNDMPVLLRVEHPVVVSADSTLHNEALKRGWRIQINSP